LKKFVVVLALLMFILVGCSVKSESSSDEQNEEPSTSDDEKFLGWIQDYYSKSDYKRILRIKEQEYNKLEDEEVIEEVHELINDSVLKILNGEGIGEFESLFFILYEPNSNQIKYDDFLTDEVRQKVIEKVNPIHSVILEEGLDVEFLEEYNEDVKRLALKSEAITWLGDNNVSYDFIHDTCTGLLVINDDNTIFEFENLKIRRIFKLKDENGNVINPYDPLEEVASKLSEINKQEAKESLDELRKEQEESKKIRIGMSKDEVLSRWGEPKDVNKTITVNYVKEQWVYAGNTYLYFEDGILTTIQN